MQIHLHISNLTKTKFYFKITSTYQIRVLLTLLIVQHLEQQQLNMGGKRHVQQHVQIENVEAKRQPAPL